MPVGPRQSAVPLHLFREVTLNIRRQQRHSLLLLMFAGITTLVSAALLRPVLKDGLRPLQDHSDRMEQIGTETLGPDRMPLAPQPRELQRIAGNHP